MEPFALQRSQPADEVCARHILLRHQILTATTVVATLRSERCTAWTVVAELGLTEDLCLIDKIGGVLMLSGTLGAYHIIAFENIHTLPAEHGMVIGSSQSISDVLLKPDAIAAVLRLTVYGIAGDTEDRLLLHQRDIVASGTIPSRHSRTDFMGAGISGVDAMVFVDQWLMPVFLRSECPSDILTAFHDLAALVVQA